MAKGSQFEREICKQLSEWWDKSDDCFWRTHGSGARATTRSKTGKKTAGQYGDICAVDNRGQAFTKVCVVSLKRGYAKTTMGDLMDSAERSAEPMFAKWIREVKRDQYSADSIGWLLIVKRNTRKTLVFMNYNLKQKLSKAGAKMLEKTTPQVSFRVKVREKPPLTKKQKEGMTAREILKDHILNNEVIYGCTLEKFLKYVTKQHFILVRRRSMES